MVPISQLVSIDPEFWCACVCVQANNIQGFFTLQQVLKTEKVWLHGFFDDFWSKTVQCFYTWLGRGRGEFINIVCIYSPGLLVGLPNPLGGAARGPVPWEPEDQIAPPRSISHTLTFNYLGKKSVQQNVLDFWDTWRGGGKGVIQREIRG